MDRIKKFNEDQFMKVLTEAKVSFDPEDNLETLNKLAVNNLETFIPALDKLFPKPEPKEKPGKKAAPKKATAKPKAAAKPTPKPKEVVELPAAIADQVQAILDAAEEKGNQIIANALKIAEKADPNPGAKPKKKLTEKELNKVVSVVVKKNWQCEMGSSLTQKGKAIDVKEGDVIELPRWMAIRLAGQDVV